MNLPPLLLGATLVFWGWQVDLFWAGGLMAILFEGTRLTRIHWSSSDEELNRLWNLVTVIFLAAAVFAFTSNEGPATYSQMFQQPGFGSSRAAGESSQRTATSLIQWMPMIFFLFVMAVSLAGLSKVKMKVLSLVARRERPGSRQPPLANREVHVGWGYFGVCLVSTSINNRNDESFFVGLCLLLAWAMWTQRSQRFALPVWACVLVTACLFAYWGQNRLGELRSWLESLTPQVSWRTGGFRTDPSRSRTAIGQIGLMKGSGRIVIRLEPESGPPPELLRTASYRYYRGRDWYAGRSREDDDSALETGLIVQTVSRTSWQLANLTPFQEFHMGTYLPGGNGLVPLPLGAMALDNFPAARVQTNGLGVVEAEGPDLVLLDVTVGTGGSIDAPPGDADRIVPEPEEEVIALTAAEIEVHPGDTDEILKEVRTYFSKNFEYSLWRGFKWDRDSAATPLASFLTQNRKGHCEYFATATVLLLRQLGIPARYAVGWAVEETAGSGYVVRERHAHAWVLYYDQRDQQWHDFDTTPASWVDAENSRASAFEFLSDFWQRFKYEYMKWRWGQSNFRDYVWWIIGPLLVFLLYRLLRRKSGGRARDNETGMDSLPERLGLDSEFFQLEKKLADLGFIRETGETQVQLIERAVKDARMANLQEVMHAIVSAHYRLRFDPLGLADEERKALALRVRETLEHLATGKAAKV